MKDGAYIINTSRGKVLETSALVKAIKSRKVRGACLDVLEYEQISFEDLSSVNPDFEWLCKSDRVVLTPHIAGWTHESNIKLSTILADKIIQLFGK